jgi:hypothetical protein
MRIVELNPCGYDIHSTAFAEELLTSPDLPEYASAARDDLLKKFYKDSIDTHAMYDIISLTAAVFRDELEDMRDTLDIGSIYENRDFAEKLYEASSTVADYLGLDLATAIKEQKHMTVYGRSSIDGLACILTMLGSGALGEQ